jgi:hypothetical protein
MFFSNSIIELIFNFSRLTFYMVSEGTDLKLDTIDKFFHIDKRSNLAWKNS